MESSDATGINGDQANDNAFWAGAVYVFTRTGNLWSQQAYVKASNTEFDPNNQDSPAVFGTTLSLSADGSILAVGSPGESSDATGVNGDQNNNNAYSSGAVYVFTRTAGQWSQQAYVKASNTDVNDLFGAAVSLSADGATLAVGAEAENSAATGINGDQGNLNNFLNTIGAVYVFTRSGAQWSQQAYVKASNAGPGDGFGTSVSLSADGATLAVGARGESSDATGVNGDQDNDNAQISGAVYVFTRNAGQWSQQAYVKASNTGAGDVYGSSVNLSADGSTLAVGALYEDSDATGINGDQTNDNAQHSGAVYTYDLGL